MIPRLLAVTVAGLFLSAGLATAALAQDRMAVVASFSVVGDLVREIGGDRVDVRALAGPDGDAHVFQPTPADAKAVAAARVFVVNGLGFEGWLDRLRRASGFKGRLIVASDGVAPLTMEEDEHTHGHGHGAAGATRRKAKAPDTVADPHAWQDPANARIYADNIARGLAQEDPANAAYYAQSPDAFKQRLDALDARLRTAFMKIPAGKRRVITSHDAFQYLARAYGIEFLAASGVSTEAEPSAKQVASLIAQIRKENVKALFVENLGNPRLIEQIARDAGGVVGGRLYSDALSPSGGPADTYLRMMEHNATALLAGMARN